MNVHPSRLQTVSQSFTQPNPRFKGASEDTEATAYDLFQQAEKAADPSEKIRLYRQAATAPAYKIRAAESIVKLGDLESARAIFDEVVTTGSFVDVMHVAKVFMEGYENLPPCSTRAENALERAAEISRRSDAKNTTKAYNVMQIAKLFAKGSRDTHPDGMLPNAEKARHFLERTADFAEATSTHFEAATLLLQGFGEVQPDGRMAAYLLASAATDHDPQMNLRIGTLFGFGYKDILPPDPYKASNCLDIAREKGNPVIRFLAKRVLDTIFDYKDPVGALEPERIPKQPNAEMVKALSLLIKPLAHDRITD